MKTLGGHTPTVGQNLFIYHTNRYKVTTETTIGQHLLQVYRPQLTFETWQRTDWKY